MKTYDQKGSGAVVLAGVMSVLFVFALIFGFVMMAGKSSLSSNIDVKVEEQLAAEVEKVEAKKATEFAEKEKSPTKVYTGPSALGSVNFNYPKTYSAYVDESGNGSILIDGFFQPNIVPKADKSVSFNLRFQVLSGSYESQLKSFDLLEKGAKVTRKPFRSALVPDVLGVRVDGEVVPGKQGSLVLIPIRDKTIKIWTESKDAIPDFDAYVVPSLGFIP